MGHGPMGVELRLSRFATMVTTTEQEVLVRFQPVAIDREGRVVTGDDGQPVAEGIPVTLVFTPELWAKFLRDNLTGGIAVPKLDTSALRL